MMCRLESCASNIAQEGWWGQLSCHRQFRGPTWLFICAFHLFPSVQLSPSSHRPRSEFARQCHVWTTVPLALWQKTKAEMCLRYERWCVCAVRPAENQTCENLLEGCVHCAVFFLRRSCLLHTKFTLVPWEAVGSCSCATCCAQNPQNTDRGPTAEIDVPSLKPACRLYINVRLSYKCREEVNVTPHGGVKCILCYISNSWY